MSARYHPHPFRYGLDPLSWADAFAPSQPGVEGYAVMVGSLVRVRVRVRVSPVLYPRGRASRGAPARDSACRGMTPVLFTLTGGLPGGRGGAGGARAARGQGVRVRGRGRHPAHLRAHLQARERVRLTCTMALLAFWRSYYSMTAHLISPGTRGSSKTRAFDESEAPAVQYGVAVPQYGVQYGPRGAECGEVCLSTVSSKL